MRRTPNGEFVVVDGEPRQVGELLTLETLEDGKPISTRVRVASSRPGVKNGNVFYELRLTPLTLKIVNKETR